MNRQQPGYAADHGYTHPVYAPQQPYSQLDYAPQPRPHPSFVPQQRHGHPGYGPQHGQGQPGYGYQQVYAAQPAPPQRYEAPGGKPRELDALLAGGRPASNRGRDLLALGGLVALVLCLVLPLGGVFLLTTA